TPTVARADPTKPAAMTIPMLNEERPTRNKQIPRTTPVRPKVKERRNAATLIRIRSFDMGTLTAFDAHTRRVRHRWKIAALIVLHRKGPEQQSPVLWPAGRSLQRQLVPGP